MNRVAGRDPIQCCGQLVAKPIEEESDAARVRDFIAVDDKKVSIPPRKVPEDTLEDRSVAAVADPQDSTVALPRYWLECTAENTAGLTEDEIVKLLFRKGKFDIGGLGIIIFCLPNGKQIACQLINNMSGDCLLRSIGGSIGLAESFAYMLFEKEFCQENLNESNLPTMEQVRNCVVEEYGSLPGEKIDELAAVLNQGSRDLILQGRHAVGTRELREIVDLVVNKFPPPDAENRVYYENIYAAVIAEFPGLDGKEEVVKLREKHPGFSLVLS